MPPLASPSDATPEWLTDVLRAGGHLPAGSVVAVEFDTGASQTASNARLRVTYCGVETPPATDLFLKIVDLDPASSFGDTEVRYYTELTAGIRPSPAPTCYHAAYDAVQERYHLLLDDLTGTHAVRDLDADPVWEHASLAVDAIALLHAHWWDSPRLADVAGPIPDQSLIDRYIAEACAGLAPMLAEAGDDVSLSERDLIHRAFHVHPFLMVARGRDTRSLTCVHGDLNPSNILLPRSSENGRAYLIDRQPFDWSLTRWAGASDLAYMMVHWWPTTVRRALEGRVLERYHKRLADLGVAYDLSDVWRDYRLCAVQSLYVAAGWCAVDSDRSRMGWLWKRQLRLTLAAMEDLACVDLLMHAAT